MKTLHLNLKNSKKDMFLNFPMVVTESSVVDNLNSLHDYTYSNDVKCHHDFLIVRLRVSRTMNTCFVITDSKVSA